MCELLFLYQGLLIKPQIREEALKAVHLGHISVFLALVRTDSQPHRHSPLREGPVLWSRPLAQEKVLTPLAVALRWA